MAAATKDRNTKCKHLDYVAQAGVEAGEVILGGVMVSLDTDGYLDSSTDTANHKCVGVSKRQYDNTDGADGDVKAEYDVGIFAFATTGANAIVKGDEGRLAYVLDDQTVVKAAGTTNSVVAGKVVEFVSASEIYIDFRIKSV
jgi:hypothetical protein